MINLVQGSIIGKASVIVDIVPKGNPEIRPATTMKPKYVTIHNTGNPGRGANAKAHNTYIHNLAGKHPKDTTHISWHLTVDENYIYQHLPFNETAWHCGDGAKGTGNMTSIGIEICEHVDQKNYAQAEANAVALAAHLVKAFGLTTKEVVPHKRWSGKNCPKVILTRDGSLDKFVAKVAADLAILNAPKAAPVKVVTYYRLKSGHYATKAAAVAAAKKVSDNGIASAKWMTITGSGSKWYWQTGTYTTKAAAEAAKKKVIDKKIAWVVEVLTA